MSENERLIHSFAGVTHGCATHPKAGENPGGNPSPPRDQREARWELPASSLFTPETSNDLSVVIDEAKLDSFHEECGVFGVYGHPEAANLVYLGLYALQHRGQESAGIVSSNGKGLIAHRGMGLVADIFNNEVIQRVEGTLAMGHNRSSTH